MKKAIGIALTLLGITGTAMAQEDPGKAVEDKFKGCMAEAGLHSVPYDGLTGIYADNKGEEVLFLRHATGNTISARMGTSPESVEVIEGCARKHLAAAETEKENAAFQVCAASEGFTFLPDVLGISGLYATAAGKSVHVIRIHPTGFRMQGDQDAMKTASDCTTKALALPVPDFKLDGMYTNADGDKVRVANVSSSGLSIAPGGTIETQQNVISCVMKSSLTQAFSAGRTHESAALLFRMHEDCLAEKGLTFRSG